MNEVYFNQLFPSHVLYRDFSPPNKELVEFSKGFLHEHGGVPFHSPCISTVKANINVLELPEFNIIKENIVELLNIYCDSLHIDTNGLGIIDSWLNRYDIHGYQDLHHHPDSMISGVYYIEGTGEKDFMFQAPFYFSQPCFPEFKELNLSNCYNVDYHSNSGRCIIFMSHLAHRTLPAKKQRMSLSFNVKYISN